MEDAGGHLAGRPAAIIAICPTRTAGSHIPPGSQSGYMTNEPAAKRATL